MWHLYTKIKDDVEVSGHDEWQGAINVLIHKYLPKCGTSVRQTMTVLVADATPEKPWSCFAEGYSFRIRPIREHPSVKEGQMNTAADIDHTAREHALLGASSCDRWWHCPGSLNLADHLMKTTGLAPTFSSYAQEGTDAHQLAHICLMKGQDAIEYVDRQVGERIIDDEMASAVQIYLDVCRSLLGPDIECVHEQKFNLKLLNPPGPMFGTADFVAIDKAHQKVTVVDLKYGKGINVEAQDNPQLKYYALGVICWLSNVPITSIETIIVQPRGMGRTDKRASYKVSDLFAWHVDLLKHAAATLDPNAPRAAGSWCRFCPAAGRCPTQTEAAYASAQAQFPADLKEGDAIPPVRLPELRLFTPQQLGAMKAQFPLLKQFMDNVEEALALHISMNGPDGTGWKLVAGEGNRAWVNEESAARHLVEKAAFGPAETHEIVMISPADAEKIIVKKLRDIAGMKAKDAQAVAKAELAKLTVRPPTKPRLVEESHQSPALLPAGSEFTYEAAPT